MNLLKLNLKDLFFLCFISLLLISASNSYSQISGVVKLEGSNVHSNVKIKFIPHSPTAKLDSTFSNIDGNYSKTIPGGIYQVVLSKPGYQSLFLNNANPFPIAYNEIIASQTLKQGKTVYVDGIVSGNWTNDNIYIINSDIQIPQDDSLIIQKGTIIKMNGNYSIYGYGAIIAQGTSTDRVLITSNLDNPHRKSWTAIYLNNSNSVLDNCVIEYCEWCIQIEDHSPKILNSEIREFSLYGIDARDSKAIINGNSLHDFGVSAIMTVGRSECKIECNEIYNGNRYGIRTTGNDIVANNILYNILDAEKGAITIERNSTPLIFNNILHNNVNGIHSGQPLDSEIHPLIYNNLLYENDTAILFAANYSGGSLFNNVIINNGIGIKQNPRSWCIDCTTPSQVSNNLFWNNRIDIENVQIIGLGQEIGFNSNGDTMDSYFNLLVDPKIVSFDPIVYDPKSPVFNAGDTNFSSQIGYLNNYDCQLNLIQQETSVNDINLEDSLIHQMVETYNYEPFPNPGLNFLSINIGNDSIQLNNLEISNSQGKSILETKNYKAGDMIDISDFESGIYYLKFEVQGQIHQRRLVKF